MGLPQLGMPSDVLGESVGRSKGLGWFPCFPPDRCDLVFGKERQLPAQTISVPLQGLSMILEGYSVLRQQCPTADLEITLERFPATLDRVRSAFEFRSGDREFPLPVGDLLFPAGQITQPQAVVRLNDRV